MKTVMKLLILFLFVLTTNSVTATIHSTFSISDTTLNQENNNRNFELLPNKEKRNHTISVEITNFYLWSITGINYDVNLYRKNNYLIGATTSVGLIGAKLGAYTGFRQRNEDCLKVEAGLGLTAGWGDGFFGPYAEFAYRSQRDTRWFYWEVNAGYIVNTFEPSATQFGMPYAGLAVGVSF